MTVNQSLRNKKEKELQGLVAPVDLTSDQLKLSQLSSVMAVGWDGAVYSKTGLNPSPIRTQGVITPVFYYIVNCGKKSIINFKLAQLCSKKRKSEQAFFLRSESRVFSKKWQAIISIQGLAPRNKIFFGSTKRQNWVLSGFILKSP